MKRVIVYTVLACALLAVAYLPPTPHGFGFGAVFSSPARSAVRRVSTYMRSEVDALILLAQRDTAMARLEPLGSHFYFAGPTLPPRLDAETRRRLSEPDSLPPHAGAPRIAVAAIADTVHRWRSVGRIPPRRAARIYYLPPSATDGETCLTVAAIGPDILWEVRRTPDQQLMSVPWTRGTLLGLCEYYHRFGQPSRAVEEWLIGGAVGHDGALVRRCADDDIDACAVLAVPAVRQRTPWGITFAAGRRSPLGTLPSFDATDEAFLDAIVDSLGVVPFRRFWQDSESVAEGFEASFGTPMVEWVQAHFEKRAVQPSAVTLGPIPNLRILLLTIGTIAICLMWAVVARNGWVRWPRPGVQ